MRAGHGNPALPALARPAAEGEHHGGRVQQVEAQGEQRASQEEGHVRTGLQVERRIAQIQWQPAACP